NSVKERAGVLGADIIGDLSHRASENSPRRQETRCQDDGRDEQSHGPSLARIPGVDFDSLIVGSDCCGLQVRDSSNLNYATSVIDRSTPTCADSLYNQPLHQAISMPYLEVCRRFS